MLGARAYHSQEALAKALAGEGWPVTQATLSRDLRSLGVGKRPDAEGRTSYVLPAPASEALDRERQWLDLKAFVNEVRVAQNLVVVRTPPGHANGVGRALDMAEFEDVVGTVAGDDTVLIVMPDPKAARRLKRRLESIAEGETPQ
jgi:transcriptional regulator of arginine metabolism